MTIVLSAVFFTLRVHVIWLEHITLVGGELSFDKLGSILKRHHLSYVLSQSLDLGLLCSFSLALTRKSIFDFIY